MQSIILSVLSIGIYLLIDTQNGNYSHQLTLCITFYHLTNLTIIAVELTDVADEILSITLNQQKQQEQKQKQHLRHNQRYLNQNPPVDMTVLVNPIALDTNTGSPTVAAPYWATSVVATTTSPSNTFTQLDSAVSAGGEENIAITSVVQSNNANNDVGVNTSGVSVGESHESCFNWHRPHHHLYFQLTNTFLLLAFLAPHGLGGMLWLRIMLVVGAIFLGMYGYMIDCAPDVIIWSTLFLGINVIYLMLLLIRLRPIRFDREIEAVSKSILLFN